MRPVQRTTHSVLASSLRIEKGTVSAADATTCFSNARRDLPSMRVLLEHGADPASQPAGCVQPNADSGLRNATGAVPVASNESDLTHFNSSHTCLATPLGWPPVGFENHNWQDLKAVPLADSVAKAVENFHQTSDTHSFTQPSFEATSQTYMSQHDT